jgi:hypothetical protein
MNNVEYVFNYSTIKHQVVGGVRTLTISRALREEGDFASHCTIDGRGSEKNKCIA